MTINSDASFEANFVLATVADADGSQQAGAQRAGQASKKSRSEYMLSISLREKENKFCLLLFVVMF